jgi:hypothetical protein
MFSQSIMRSTKQLVIILISISTLFTTCYAFIEGLYCGRQNCYDGIYYFIIYKTICQLIEGLTTFYKLTFNININ